MKYWLISLLVLTGFATAAWYVATSKPTVSPRPIPVESCHHRFDCDLLQQLALVRL